MGSGFGGGGVFCGTFKSHCLTPSMLAVTWLPTPSAWPEKTPARHPESLATLSPLVTGAAGGTEVSNEQVVQLPWRKPAKGCHAKAAEENPPAHINAASQGMVRCISTPFERDNPKGREIPSGPRLPQKASPGRQTASVLSIKPV